MEEENGQSLTVWDLVELVLSATPDKRKKVFLKKLVPWFHERSPVFKGLDEGNFITLIGRIFHKFYSLFEQEARVWRKLVDCV